MDGQIYDLQKTYTKLHNNVTSTNTTLEETTINSIQYKKIILDSVVIFFFK